jgi:cobalamin biosynthesis protein CobD/CbiB
MAKILIYVIVALMEVLDERLDFVKKGMVFLNIQKLFSRGIAWLDKIMLNMPMFNGPLGLGVIAFGLLLSLGIIEFIVLMLLSKVGVVIFTVAVVCLVLASSYADLSQPKFVNYNDRLFAPIFWLICFGWAGAVLYWLLLAIPAEVRKIDNCKKLSEITTTVHRFAAWIPARIAGLIYALAGNFSTTHKIWLDSVKQFGMSNNEFLSKCGEGAVAGAHDAAKEQALLRRAVAIWCVLGALFAFII